MVRAIALEGLAQRRQGRVAVSERDQILQGLRAFPPPPKKNRPAIIGQARRAHLVGEATAWKQSF